jgi:hypothetical protein
MLTIKKRCVHIDFTLITENHELYKCIPEITSHMPTTIGDQSYGIPHLMSFHGPQSSCRQVLPCLACIHDSITWSVKHLNSN